MRAIWVSLRALLFFTFVAGVLYPIGLTFLSQMAFPDQAGGSLVWREGKIVGSVLLAQEFRDDRYFWPRPSAVGYNPLPSGGSNLGPTSRALKEAETIREEKGMEQTASASGLDPHISPQSAYRQMARVAHARGWEERKVKSLVDLFVEPPQFGFLGESRVNVLHLNIALDEGESPHE